MIRLLLHLITQLGKIRILTTEEKILVAAREEFLSTGYAAARMRSIAEKAEINKGLLHYYFKSKDALFFKVFEDSFKQVMDALRQAFSMDVSVFEKVEAFVDIYANFLSQNPSMPLFILTEVNRDPETQFTKMRERGFTPPSELFIKTVEDAKEKGEIRADICAVDLIMNMMSMMIFPTISKPMTKMILGMTEEEHLKLLSKRKSTVKSFIIKAIQP